MKELLEILSGKQRIWILTGAGISAASGIPTYRDHQGNWKHSKPIQHDEFVNDLPARKKYWMRSLAGFPHFSTAIPNAAHHAFTKLQQSGRISQLVTQNVDGLHSRAETSAVIDLHGRLDQIVCLSCGYVDSRYTFQDLLAANNPNHIGAPENVLPDGDADIEAHYSSDITIPGCASCGGIVKPDVVFFGGKTPDDKVKQCWESVTDSDCVLVCGSSLSVYSGYRFVKYASEIGLSLVAINQGVMRGEALFDYILPRPCETAVPELVAQMTDL